MTGEARAPGRGADAMPLRPMLPRDVDELRELFVQSIDVLTQDDYDEDQRLAWAGCAGDKDAFAKRLMTATTLVVERDGALLGFASLKGNAEIDMLYVHPYAVGEGVATTLVKALETLARGRGTETITVDSSETAVEFFETRGYTGLRRNSVNIDDQWLTNTTMTKPLVTKAGGSHD